MPASSTSPVNVFNVEGSFDPGTTLTELRVADGRVLRIPTALLSDAAASGEHAPEGLAGFKEGTMELIAAPIAVPLIEERLEVSKRTIPTGKVRLHKDVREYDVQLDEPLQVNTWDVERVPLNRPVEAVPDVRQEGNTTVYPLVEEQLVITKQLILKEEVRVTRKDFEHRDTQTVTLRQEVMTVERETLK